MKNNSALITVVVALVVGAGAFYGGMKYQETKASGNPDRGQVFRMQVGQGGQNKQFGMRGAMGGATTGEVLSVDENTITVKLPDGGSKIVVLSDSTTYNKSESASKSDVKVGEKIAAFGNANSDGSVTAQNVQLNPMMRTFQGGSRGDRPTQ